MTIELTWLIPDSILLSRWIDDVSRQDLKLLIDDLSVIFAVAPRLVHTIIDLTDARSIEYEALAIYMASDAPRHPRRGRIAIVDPPPDAISVIEILNNAARQQMLVVFETQQQAREFLLANDSPAPLLDRED